MPSVVFVRSPTNPLHRSGIWSNGLNAASPSVEQTELAGDKAYVDTERQAPLGGGALRYTLHRRK
jgi:hypothetical protein